MTATTAIQRHCGATTRRGTTCRRPAGWGTSHLGHGNCKLHLGSTRSHVRQSARAQALQFVSGQMGAEVEIDLLEAPLIALRIAFGIVMAWRKRIADCDGKTDAIMDEGLRVANMDLARIAKMAGDAGVAERQIKVMERAAEQLSLLFEELVAAAKLTREQHELALEAWVRGLARLEAETVDSTATELAA